MLTIIIELTLIEVTMAELAKHLVYFEYAISVLKTAVLRFSSYVTSFNLIRRNLKGSSVILGSFQTQ